MANSKNNKNNSTKHYNSEITHDNDDDNDDDEYCEYQIINREARFLNAARNKSITAAYLTPFS